MDENGRRAALKKSGQKLKKLVSMKGLQAGAFILIPNGKLPYLFLDTGPTANGAAKKITGSLKSFADKQTKELICGQVAFDADSGQLHLAISKVGSVKPKVKAPGKLQKNLKFIATGGLSALKQASITVGSSAFEPGESPPDITSDSSAEEREDNAVVVGSAISSEALEAFAYVDLDEEDQQEITDVLFESGELIRRMDLLLDEPGFNGDESSAPISLAALSGEIIGEQRVKAARALFSDDTALRLRIKAVVYQDYNAADCWNDFTLSLRLLRDAGFEDLLSSAYHVELADRLGASRCSYAVESCSVTGLGLGLEGFDCPLNHGLINIHGLNGYQTVERGGLVSPAGRPRRHIETFTVSFVKFGNLIGASYKVGGGSLGSVVPWKSTGEFHFYRGYVSDCWSYIEDVLLFAGLPAPVNRRVENEGNARALEESSLKAKLMKQAGLIGEH